MARCFRCRGTGRVDVDISGVSWFKGEGRCPVCGGTGEGAPVPITAVIIGIIILGGIVLALIKGL